MGGTIKRSLICVTILLLAAISVYGQSVKIAVLSPTPNQVLHLEDQLFFDYAPLDSSIKQLNIFLDSFGKVASENPVKLVADISKSPNGTYTADNKTYNKYSLFYKIPSDFPVENEAYQVSFETSNGNVVIPIKVERPTATSIAIVSSTQASVVHVTQINLPTAAVSSNRGTISSATVINTASPFSTVAASTTHAVSSRTLINTASPFSTVTSSTRAVFASSVTSMLNSTHPAVTAPSSQTPMSSAVNITSSSTFQTSSSSFSSSPTSSLTSSTSKTSSTSTSSSSWTGLFSASLIASTTPIPPDPASFMHSSAATRAPNHHGEFSFIAATLIALLLVRLLLV